MSPSSQVRLIALPIFFMSMALVEAHEGHQPLPTKGVQVDIQRGQLTLSAQACNAIGLQTEEVKVGTVSSSLKVYAESVTPWHSKAYGSAQISGRIAKLLVRPGDFVEKDQVVAELSSRELESVKLDYLQATKDLELNQRLLAMTRPSAQAGAVPMQRLLDIENAIQQSKNRLEVARIRAQTLGVRLDISALNASDALHYQIRSPIAGQVLHLDLAEGKYVDAFGHLFEIVNTDEVWVRLQLLEKDILHTNIGDRVTVEFEGSDISAEAVIDMMDASLDSRSQISSAWVSLENKGILPGLVGQATIYTSERTGSVTVPQRAVYSDGLQNYVFVEEASTRKAAEFRKRNIRLGKRVLATQESAEPMVEVIQGDIFPGDRVVVRGGHELSTLFFLGVLKLSNSDQQRLGILSSPAAYRPVARTIQLSASVTLPPESVSVLSSQISGTIYSHSLRPGRTVNVGETLIEIASPDFYKLQLELISTLLDADLSLRRAARLEEIKGDAVSPRMALETRAQAEQLKSRAESLARQLATLGLFETEVDSIVKDHKVLDYLPIRSNIVGRITLSEVTLGQTVSASQPLAEVQNLDSIWIEAHVPSQEARSIRQDATGIASLLANPDLRFPVVLSRISPIVNESTRTQRIWLTPDPKAEIPQVLSGALITVHLSVGDATSSLAIPSSAILRDGSSYFAFVQKSDGYIERRRVSIGRTDGEYTEVKGGIVDGEIVVTVGARELQTAFASLR